MHRAARSLGTLRALERRVGDRSADRDLTGPELAAARALARETYYAELDAERARRVTA
jgi:hypothetical protein